ncbi:MAG: DedA family protein [Wolbachia endosymbiont of Fragariocoptes setiger]|nr:DedA family protein [Wolbachia endosymbiont of Fragariocoptes setiger]
MKSYVLLFQDNFLSSVILPIHKGFVFEVMLYFKQYHNIVLMLLFGILGSCLGGSINWILGRLILFIRKLYDKLQDSSINSKTVRNLLIFLILLFSWMPPLGGIVQITSGYFNLNPIIVIALVTLSNLLCLFYYIITI